uniref:Uncharacterized protein n=1 Tax=Arundo donax TaxID=35708 RepID=A0A0A8ZJR5_ARUDO
MAIYLNAPASPKEDGEEVDHFDTPMHDLHFAATQDQDGGVDQLDPEGVPTYFDLNMQFSELGNISIS